MKRVVIIILLLAAIAGGAYYATMDRSGDIELTGIVTTDDVIVSSQILGRVQQLLVDQGKHVKYGDLLAVIQPEQWLADAQYYQGVQRQAATQVSQAESDLKFIQEQTSSQITQAQANLAASTAAVKEGEADEENARLEYEREKTAFDKGNESREVYDQSRTAYEAAQAHVETLRKQAAAAEAAVGMAQSNLQEIDARRDALESAKHQLESAQAQLDKAKIELGYTSIVAPVSGIVDVRAARQGEVVNPSQPIVTLINEDNLWVRIDVEESYIDQIHDGDVLQMRLPSGTQRQGTVIYRGVDADYATQRDVSRTKRDIKTFEVRLQFDNSQRDFAVGMTVYVTLPKKK